MCVAEVTPRRKRNPKATLPYLPFNRQSMTGIRTHSAYNQITWLLYEESHFSRAAPFPPIAPKLVHTHILHNLRNCAERWRDGQVNTWMG